MAQPVFNTSMGRTIRLMEELPGLDRARQSSFTDMFRKALNDASDLQEDSQRLITAFVRGEPVELHRVMAAAEEASISLELLVEIRNKLTEAYRTVMNLS